MTRPKLPDPRSDREVILGALSAFAPRYVVEWIGKVLDERREATDHYRRIAEGAGGDAAYWRRQAHDAKRIAKDKAAHAARLEDELLARRNGGT